MKSYKAFLWTSALVLYGLATIATCSAVWDNPDEKPILYVIAGIVFLANGYAIWRKAKDLSEKGIK